MKDFLLWIQSGVSEFFTNHPKITRALHTFWQAALGVVLAYAITWLQVLATGEAFSFEMFTVLTGAISAGLSAMKSELLGVPEEQ